MSLLEESSVAPPERQPEAGLWSLLDSVSMCLSPIAGSNLSPFTVTNCHCKCDSSAEFYQSF